jgi:nitroreductase
MSTLTSSDLLAQLQWRYATKAFDPARKIPADVWSALEQSLVLTPSSFGLQPWKFIVVTDPAVRAQLSAVSWNQQQPVQCSHHVVFTARKTMDADEVNRFLASTVAVRGGKVEDLASYGNIINGFIANAAKQGWLGEWATRQTYIAIGQFMASCAVLGIDACPMEGISATDYDRILGLDGTDYRTVVACAAGYRAADDKYAVLPKVRYPASELISHI